MVKEYGHWGIVQISTWIEEPKVFNVVDCVMESKFISS